MIAFDHFPHDPSEFVKLNRFLRVQVMRLEERHNHFSKIFQISHPPAVPVPVIAANDAAFHGRPEAVEEIDVSLVLHDCQFGEYLIAKANFRMPADADVEATFAIDKPDNPVGV